MLITRHPLGFIMVKKSVKKEKDIWYVLGVVGQLGFIIALPAALFAYLGHLLDVRYQTSPWLLIAGLALAFTVSFSYIFKMIKKLE